MAAENKVIKALRVAQSSLSSGNPILQSGQRVYSTGISLSVRDPRKIGDGSTAYNLLPFIDTLQIQTSSDYDLTQAFLSVDGNEVEITNIGSASIILTTEGDPITLDAGETGKYRRISGEWVATAATGDGGGVPNYLGDKASDWTPEAGWELTEETTNPIDLEGTIKVTADGEPLTGFYQDVNISEIDRSSLLQSLGYFKNIFPDVTEGLVAKYKLDGDATDSAGNNDGTLSGFGPVVRYFLDGNSNDEIGSLHGVDTAITYITGTGITNQAAEFDGAISKITIADATVIQDIWAGGGSLSCKINPYSDGESGGGIIADKRSFSGAGWLCQVGNESGGFCQILFLAEGSTTSGSWNTTTSIPINSASRITLEWDSDNPTVKPKIFLNEIELAVSGTNLVGTYQSDVGNDLVIGNRPGQDLTFDGWIDDLELDGYLLSQAEISALYNRPQQPSYWVDGVSGKALSFNNLTTQVQSTSAINHGTGDFSFTFNCKMNGAKAVNGVYGNRTGVFSTGGIGVIIFFESNGHIKASIGDGTNYVVAQVNTGLIKDIVYSISCIYDRTDTKTIRIYVDGVYISAIDISSVTGTITNPSGLFEIGVIDSNNDYVFDGWLDEVRIYNIALTADEVLAISQRIDFNDIHLQVLDQDNSDYVLFDSTLEDISTENSVTKVNFFDAIYNTSNNENMRIKFYKENYGGNQSFYMSRLFLGQVSTFSAPLNSNKAGEMYYSTEVPVNGLNESGDFAFDDTETFNLADYPAISAKQTALDGKYIDVTGSTFKMKNLLFDSGWVNRTDWTNKQITIAHSLGFDISALDIKIMFSPDGTDGNSVKEGIFARVYASATPLNQYIGVSYFEINTDNLTLQTGTDGVRFISAAGTEIVLGSSQSYYYKIVVTRKDAPQDGTYAYMRHDDVQTVELFKKQTNREDVEDMYYSTQAPTAGKNRQGDLAFDGTTVHNWSEYAELNKNKTELLASDIFDDSTIDPTGSQFVLKAISPALGWRTVWEGTPTGNVSNIVANYGEGHYRVLARATSATNTAVRFYVNTENTFNPTADVASTSFVSTTTPSDMFYARYDRSTDAMIFSQAGTYSPRYDKIEKLEEVGYAYLRTKSLSTVIAAENLNQPGYNGSTYRPDVADISAADATYNLDQYLSTGSSPKLDGWRIKPTWTGGDASFYHRIISSLNLYNEYADLPAGDASSTFWMVGYGSGGITFVKDEANSRWIIETEGVYDKGSATLGEWELYTSKKTVCKDIYSQLISTSGSGAVYADTVASRNFPMPFKSAPYMPPMGINTTNSAPFSARAGAVTATSFTARIFVSITVSITISMNYETSGESRD